jgi:hypothetical protein
LANSLSASSREGAAKEGEGIKKRKRTRKCRIIFEKNGFMVS